MGGLISNEKNASKKSNLLITFLEFGFNNEVIETVLKELNFIRD